mmetsp:Transcript_25778/g.84851  ORF Transcript_25778/g.84851 Transcript_25778/m.84851 type:complete len:414 (+) Transcript_25778:1006-2247(+)
MSGDKPLGEVCLFRHGARGPSKTALKSLDIPEVTNEWLPEEVEELSPVGLEQMRALGEHAAARLQRELPAVFAREPTAHKWRSSSVSRVRMSGESFWRGFCSVAQHSDEGLAPEPYSAPDTADDHFRAWNIDPAYLAVVKQVRSGDVFRRKAEEESATLTPLTSKVLQKAAELPPEKRLDCMTYLQEMVDCERYTPDRRALLDLLAPADLAAVERFAHWCWDKRFFVDDRDLRFAIGGRMLADIVSDLSAMAAEATNAAAGVEQPAQSPSPAGAEEPATAAEKAGVPRFGAYSGHDYTILSLLSALGVKNYPAQILGYGAHMFISIRRQPAGAPIEECPVVIHLNMTPFEEPADSAPCPTVQLHNVAELTFTLGELAARAKAVENTIPATVKAAAKAEQAQNTGPRLERLFTN